MKKFNKAIIAAILTTSLYGTAFAHGGEMKKYGIVELPHPLKLAIEKSDELKLDTKQQETLSAIIGENPIKVLPLFEAADKLEKKIKHSFMHDDKSKAELEADIKELTKLKTQITEYQMSVIEKMKATMSKEQWGKLIGLMKNKKGC